MSTWMCTFFLKVCCILPVQVPFLFIRAQYWTWIVISKCILNKKVCFIIINKVFLFETYCWNPKSIVLKNRLGKPPSRLELEPSLFYSMRVRVRVHREWKRRLNQFGPRWHYMHVRVCARTYIHYVCTHVRAYINKYICASFNTCTYYCFFIL